MGSNSATGGGGGGNRSSANNVPPSRRKYDVSGTLADPREKDDTAAKMDLFINDPYTKKQGGPIVLRPFEPFFDKSAKATRQFFTNKVLESKRAKKNIGYTKDEFSKLSRTKQEEVYKGYMSKRMSNETDAYGNKITSTGGDNNQVVQAPTQAAPTEAELSQSAATDVDAKEDDILYRKRKTKRTGRSMLVVTSPQGDTSGLTLGKKSLLGS